MKKYFIVSLNPIDCLTISGIIISLFAAALVLAGEFSLALSLLFIAMLVDALDGVLARKFGMESDFGRYLDGFVDVFDYLAVPALFLYRWGFNTWYYGIILVLFIVSGVVRLSVFNEIGNIKDDKSGLAYLGMPVFWSVLFLGMLYIADWFFPHGALFPLVAGLFTLFSLCMVYRRSFFKFKSIPLMLTVILGTSLLLALDGFGVVHFREIAGGQLMHDVGRHILSGFFSAIPAIIGGSLSMLVMSRDWLSFLTLPVSEKALGSNKTIRDFILMPVFTIFGALVLRGILILWPVDLTIDLLAIPFWQIGLVQGFGYELFELTNSFLKKRLGIQPGEVQKKKRLIFIFIDQIDSGFGVALGTWLFFPISTATAIAIVVLFPLVALAAKKVLWKQTSPS